MPSQPAIPLPYRIFFLYLEPFSALLGAFYAAFFQYTYLSLTTTTTTPQSPFPPSPSPSPLSLPLPLSVHITLLQLSNLYFLFALNEALVLRSTSDLRVWRTLLFGLLVGDFGHLWSVRGLGHRVYWYVGGWNAMDWGNVGVVYLGAGMRMCFLLGVGVLDGNEQGTGRKGE